MNICWKSLTGYKQSQQLPDPDDRVTLLGPDDIPILRVTYVKKNVVEIEQLAPFAIPDMATLEWAHEQYVARLRSAQAVDEAWRW